MNSRFIYKACLLLGFVAVYLTAPFGNTADSHSSGAPAGKTGSPGDNSTCTSCHSGPAASAMAGWITSTIPAAGYRPGTTYSITATATRQGHSKFGFEISPQNIAGNLLGTMILTNTTATKLISSGKYITHTSSGTSGSGSRTWSFDWTAPSAGTGNVTFYGAFNATNSMNNSSGDSIFLSTLAVTECVIPGQPGTISGNNLVCFGALVTYTVSPVPGATGYIWTLPPGWTGISATNSITATVGNSSGTVSVSAMNSCGTGATRTMPVTVSQLLVTASSVSVTCFGLSNGSASATAGTGIPPYTYFWSPTGATTSAVNNLPAGNYTVTVTDAAGCTGTSSVAVTQPAQLLANSGDDVSICAGSQAQIGLSPVAAGGVGPYSFFWSPSAGLSSPIDSTPIASPSGTTNYQLTVTDANGCTALSAITVTVFPAVVIPGITFSSDTLFSTAASAYQWYLNGNSIPGATQSFFVPSQNGNYTVEITDANGCTAMSAPFMLTSTDETFFSDGTGDGIYPNPFEAETFIRYSLRSQSVVTIELLSVNGALPEILLRDGLPAGRHEFRISAEELRLSGGIYCVRIQAGDESRVFRFISGKR